MQCESDIIEKYKKFRRFESIKFVFYIWITSASENLEQKAWVNMEKR